MLKINRKYAALLAILMTSSFFALVGVRAHADGIEVRRAFEGRGFTGKTTTGKDCFVKFYVPDSFYGPFSNWLDGDIAMTISNVMPPRFLTFHGDPANDNALNKILGHNSPDIISAHWTKDSQVRNLSNKIMELHIKSSAGIGGATVWRIFMDAQGTTAVHAKRFDAFGNTTADVSCSR
jgi:hypothetical protein